MSKAGFGAIILAAGLVLAASGAEAQTRTRSLGDGRVVTVPVQVANCSRAEVTEDTAEALTLDYSCTVESAEGGQPDTEGTGALVIMGTPQRQMPLQFLAAHARSWWPEGFNIEDVASYTTKSTANGEVALYCIYRDDVAALAGDAVCVIDQPTLQVVIGGRSTMALTADNVVDLILRSLTIR